MLGNGQYAQKDSWLVRNICRIGAACLNNLTQNGWRVGNLPT